MLKLKKHKKLIFIVAIIVIILILGGVIFLLINKSKDTRATKIEDTIYDNPVVSVPSDEQIDQFEKYADEVESPQAKARTYYRLANSYETQLDNQAALEHYKKAQELFDESDFTDEEKIQIENNITFLMQVIDYNKQVDANGTTTD